MQRALTIFGKALVFVVVGVFKILGLIVRGIIAFDRSEKKRVARDEARSARNANKELSEYRLAAARRRASRG